tara:strand:+ start:20 stop:229 length:210 start_codon:yes stop_codon:yes gene_type:complete
LGIIFESSISVSIGLPLIALPWILKYNEKNADEKEWLAVFIEWLYKKRRIYSQQRWPYIRKTDYGRCSY